MEAMIALTKDYTNILFYKCVGWLKVWSLKLDMTYEELNVLLFCLLTPFLILMLLFVIGRLLTKNSRLRRRTTSKH